MPNPPYRVSKHCLSCGKTGKGWSLKVYPAGTVLDVMRCTECSTKWQAGVKLLTERRKAV